MANQRPIKLSFSTAFQVRYCLLIVIVFAVANVLFYLMIDTALSGSYLENLSLLYQLEENLPFYLSLMALLQIIFILFLTLIITLLVSHQIAGPVFRYEKILGEVVAGTLSGNVATRSTDQLKPMVESLNQLTSYLHDIYSGAQSLQEKTRTDTEVLQQIAEVRKNMGSFYPEENNR